MITFGNFLLKIERVDKIGLLIVGANKVSVGIARLLNSIENIDVTVVDLNRKRVQYSRLDGVKSMHTSIFSPRVVEDMHLGAYRYLIALTENDELNSLSCIQYSEVIGSENVFRFPPISINASQTEALKMVDLGTNIVDFDFHYVMSIFHNNDSFKLITIVDEMDKAKFTEQYGGNLVPIIGVSATNKLLPAKDIDLFQKNDRWIVLDKLIK